MSVRSWLSQLKKMREKLKDIRGMRQRFTGTFERFGTKPAYKGAPIKTVLLVDVKNQRGEEVCDHIWFTSGKQFESLELRPGDKICFDARVKSYIKGYRGRREDYDAKPVTTDYKLSHPNNFVKHLEGAQGMLF